MSPIAPIVSSIGTTFGHAWTPGTAVFQYPNDHRAATLWYHDHTLGMTRVNVYAGPAGFYLVRGGPDDQVIDSRFGTKAILPGPAPTLGDPQGVAYYEIPIAVQDRSFNDDGSLFYPDTREFFDGATANDPGYIPRPTSPRSGTPSSLGTRSWSTARPGRSSRWSSDATGSVS